MADTNTSTQKWPIPPQPSPPILGPAVPGEVRWFLTALARGHGDGDGWLK